MHHKTKISKKQNNSNVARKIDWEKVDKEWCSALTDTKTINLKSKSKDVPFYNKAQVQHHQ
jgi:hypothetical protein